MTDQMKKVDAVIEPMWMTAKSISEQQLPDVPWLWRGFIGRGLTSLFSAKPKLGKTTLTFDFMKSAAEDKPFLGQPVNLKGKILLLTEEPLILIKRRVDRLELADEKLLVIQKVYMKNWTDVLNQVRLAIEKENVELIILDTLASFWGVEIENDAHDVISALQPLQAISQEKNVALLLIHHLRKMQGTDGSAHRGSGALLAIVDIAIEFHKSASGGTRRELKALSRFEETMLEITAEQKDGSYSGLGSPGDLQHDEICRKIIDLLPEPGGVSIDRDSIMERLNPKPSESLVKKILSELAQGEKIEQHGKGTKGSPFQYRKKGVSNEQ